MAAAALYVATALTAPADASGLLPANDIMPGVDDFRLQKIRQAQGESDWPFLAKEGVLLCAKVLKQPAVYFVPETPDGKQGLPFAISGDMMELALVNIGNSGVLRPYDNFEQLLKRLFPYVSMGRRLCDQPAGTELPDNAL